MPDGMIKNGDIVEIKERLATIETAIMFIKDAIAVAPKPGEAAVCKVEVDRLGKLETAIARQYIIAMTLGAVGGGVVLALRVWL